MNQEAVSDLRQAALLKASWASAAVDESYFDPIRESEEFQSFLAEHGFNA